MTQLQSANHSSLSEIERKLREDWMEILQLSEVGVNDHFLDIGGDSLSAMRCIARMRTNFDVEVTLESFFLEDEATIASFARIVESLMHQ